MGRKKGGKNAPGHVAGGARKGAGRPRKDGGRAQARDRSETYDSLLHGQDDEESEDDSRMIAVTDLHPAFVPFLSVPHHVPLLVSVSHVGHAPNPQLNSGGRDGAISSKLTVQPSDVTSLTSRDTHTHDQEDPLIMVNPQSTQSPHEVGSSTMTQHPSLGLNLSSTGKSALPYQPSLNAPGHCIYPISFQHQARSRHINQRSPAEDSERETSPNLQSDPLNSTTAHNTSYAQQLPLSVEAQTHYPSPTTPRINVPLLASPVSTNPPLPTPPLAAESRKFLHQYKTQSSRNETTSHSTTNTGGLYLSAPHRIADAFHCHQSVDHGLPEVTTNVDPEQNSPAVHLVPSLLEECSPQATHFSTSQSLSHNDNSISMQHATQLVESPKAHPAVSPSFNTLLPHELRSTAQRNVTANHPNGLLQHALSSHVNRQTARDYTDKVQLHPSSQASQLPHIQRPFNAQQSSTSARKSATILSPSLVLPHQNRNEIGSRQSQQTTPSVLYASQQSPSSGPNHGDQRMLPSSTQSHPLMGSETLSFQQSASRILMSTNNTQQNQHHSGQGARNVQSRLESQSLAHHTRPLSSRQQMPNAIRPQSESPARFPAHPSSLMRSHPETLMHAEPPPGILHQDSTSSQQTVQVTKNHALNTFEDAVRGRHQPMTRLDSEMPYRSYTNRTDHTSPSGQSASRVIRNRVQGFSSTDTPAHRSLSSISGTQREISDEATPEDTQDMDLREVRPSVRQRRRCAVCMQNNNAERAFDCPGRGDRARCVSVNEIAKLAAPRPRINRGEGSDLDELYHVTLNDPQGQSLSEGEARLSRKPKSDEMAEGRVVILASGQSNKRKRRCAICVKHGLEGLDCPGRGNRMLCTNLAKLTIGNTPQR